MLFTDFIAWFAAIWFEKHGTLFAQWFMLLVGLAYDQRQQPAKMMICFSDVRGVMGSWHSERVMWKMTFMNLWTVWLKSADGAQYFVADTVQNEEQ